jgi:hypothetical protein
MAVTANPVDSCERLLRDFQNLGHLNRRRKTLLEIAKRTDSELIHSNILAFFLDPREEHGLGDLFLASLLKASRSPLNNETLKQVEVFTEDPTNTKKRIDIVVQGSTFLIGIENKIRARVTNPLVEYGNRLEERAFRGKIRKQNILKIILSTKLEVAQAGFQPLTYGQVFSIVTASLPQANKETKTGLSYLSEFMTTIENLKKPTRLDQRFLTLIRQKQTTAVRFYLECANLLKEMNEKADRFRDGMELPAGFSPLVWDRKPSQDWDFFFSTLSSGVKPEKGVSLCAQAELRVTGWEVSIYDYDSQDTAHVNWWLHRINKDRKRDLYDSLDYGAPIPDVQKSFRSMCLDISDAMACRKRR